MKLSDWEIRLQRHIEDYRHKTFQWGIVDCCTFAAKAVELQTGKDVMVHFSYANEPRHVVQLVRHLETILDARLQCNGFFSIHPLLGQRGDVVLGKTPKDRSFVGIVSLDGWTCFAADLHGLANFPLSAMKRAWRIA